jgi:hypothetical protein
MRMFPTCRGYDGENPQADKSPLMIAGPEHWNDRYRTVLYILYPILILFRFVSLL